MLALLSAIFVASLLGSTHCAGMCGAFVAFSVGSPGADRPHSRLTLVAAYNLGRLITYTVLGAVAGAFGNALDLGGSMIGVQRTAAIVAGTIMGVFGVVSVLRQMGVGLGRVPVPGLLVAISKRGYARAFALPPVSRAATIGLLTTLIPCGWLYAFVVAAAGTGGTLNGAAAMMVFWLGTLPVMGALGLGLQALTGPFRRHLPLTMSLVLVVAGLWTVFGRMALPAVARTASVPVGFDQAARAVDAAGESCPFCRGSAGAAR